MSRKLLSRGKQKLERQLPLNQHLRITKSRIESRVGLDVPSDFKEFAKLCRIRSAGSIVAFNLWDWQIELSEVADKCRGLIVLKSRQMGLTEFFATKMLHRCCLSSAYVGVCLSMGGSQTSAIAKRIRRMPSQIPNFKFETNAVRQLEVQGGGSLSFLPSTPNSARSLESVCDLLIDEAGFIKNPQELYSSAMPSQEMLGENARTWIISTVPIEGKLSWYWSMFDSSNSGVDIDRNIALAREGVKPFQWWIDDNGWAKVIVHWRCHPIYSKVPDYLAKTKKEKKLTEEKLLREYDLALPDSGGSLFKINLIPLLATGNWEEFNPGSRYLAGIDPNFGSDDYFCLQVWDITKRPYKLVKQYRRNQSSNTYNLMMSVAILKQYNPTITAVEDNSGGAVILENLMSRCPNLRIEKVTTTGKSKIINTDRVAYLLENQEIIYPSDWEGCSDHEDESGNSLKGEFYQFSASERKALKGHDDTIMSAATAFAWLEEVLK